MRIFPQNKSLLRRQSGLTLVEMMVATFLLTVMILGLTAMFNQTQRAFRSGLKQVDVFEGGRAVMDIIVRDIEQIAASRITNNLYAGPLPGTSFIQLSTAGAAGFRTNVLFGVYLLNHSTDWTALAYRVLNSQTTNANNLIVGSLYRVSANFPEFGNENYLTKFLQTDPRVLIDNGSMSRVADGVVHFRLQFYDNAGNVVYINQPPAIYVSTNNLIKERITVFNNDALPAMVEVELGILEPQTLEQARSMPVASQKAYLEKQAGKVHIFRQQIPIRNALR